LHQVELLIIETILLPKHLEENVWQKTSHSLNILYNNNNNNNKQY
jgi:hypothetical protein